MKNELSNKIIALIINGATSDSVHGVERDYMTNRKFPAKQMLFQTRHAKTLGQLSRINVTRVGYAGRKKKRPSRLV